MSEKAKRIFDIKAPLKRESWQRRPANAGDSVFVRIGYASELEDGRIVMTLNVIPVGDRWDGTATLFPKEESIHD